MIGTPPMVGARNIAWLRCFMLLRCRILLA